MAPPYHPYHILPLVALGLATGWGCVTSPSETALPEQASREVTELLRMAEQKAVRPAERIGPGRIRIEVLAKNPDPRLALPPHLAMTGVYGLECDFARRGTGGLALQLESLQTNPPGFPVSSDARKSLEQILWLSLAGFFPVPPLGRWAEQALEEPGEGGHRKIAFRGSLDPAGKWIAARCEAAALWIDPAGLPASFQYQDGPARYRIQYEWQPSMYPEFFFVRTLRHEVILPGDERPFSQELSFHYGVVEGAALPLEIHATSVVPDGRPGWSVQLRFSNFTVRGEQDQPGWAEAELEHLDRRIYRIARRVRALRVEGHSVLESAMPDFPIPPGVRVLCAFRASLRLDPHPALAEGLVEQFEILSVATDSPGLSVDSDVTASLRREFPRTLEKIFQPDLGLTAQQREILGAERRQGVTEIRVRERREGRTILRVFGVDRAGKLAWLTFQEGALEVRHHFEWDEDPASGSLVLRSLRTEHPEAPSRLVKIAGRFHSKFDFLYRKQGETLLPDKVEIDTYGEGSEKGEKVGYRERYEFTRYELE